MLRTSHTYLHIVHSTQVSNKEENMVGTTCSANMALYRSPYVTSHNKRYQLCLFLCSNDTGFIQKSTFEDI